MNGTDHFKRTIQAYLDSRAAEDKLFAASYHKPNKSIDECVAYILNWVKKSGCNGFTDGEIYSRGTDRRGKGGSKKEGGCAIPTNGTS